MAKYIAYIYYSGCVEAEGDTEEEAIDYARNQLPFSCDTEDDITVQPCDREEEQDE